MEDINEVKYTSDEIGGHRVSIERNVLRQRVRNSIETSEEPGNEGSSDGVHVGDKENGGDAVHIN